MRTIYSSDRRRAAGFVTLIPRTFALSKQRKILESAPKKDGTQTNVPIENSSAVAAAHIVGNFGSEALVVHKEKVDFSDVVDKELLETVGEQMARLWEELGLN